MLDVEARLASVWEGVEPNEKPPERDFLRPLSFTSKGGSLGRTARSSRYFAKRDARIVGAVGETGEARDDGRFGTSAPIPSSCSSKLETRANSDILVRRLHASLTSLLIRSVHRPPGFAPERLQI